MRIAALLPTVALLCFQLLPMGAGRATATGPPDPAKLERCPIAPHYEHIGTSNVLDMLEASPDHHVLVRLVQRAGMIPVLNKLQHRGVDLTFLAPIDSAWPSSVQAAFSNDSIAEPAQIAALGSLLRMPNASSAQLNRELSDLLHYHIVGRLLTDYLHPPASPTRQLESTLLIPHYSRGVGSDKTSRSNKRLLTGHQKIFADYSGNVTFGWSYGQVPTESSNKSAVTRIVSGLYGVNCPKALMVAVDAVLERPPSLTALLQTHPQLSYLSSLMELSVGRFPFPIPLDSRDVVAFLPSNDALTPTSSTKLQPPLSSLQLTSDETHWLEDPNDALAAHDRAKLFGWHIASTENVLYQIPRDKKKREITMTQGGSYTLKSPNSSNQKPMLGHAPVVEESILIENGVVHLLGAALSPYLAPPAKSILPMNVHRLLVARGASHFAFLLHQSGLGWAIDQPAWPSLEDPSHLSSEKTKTFDSDTVPDRLTILALTDDFLTGLALPPGYTVDPDRMVLGPGQYYDLAASVAQPADETSKGILKDQLSYHILPDAWGIFNLSDPGVRTSARNSLKYRYLLPTELYPSGLGGRRQRLDVRVQIPLHGDPKDDDDDSDRFDEFDTLSNRSIIDHRAKASSGSVQITFGGRAPLDLEPVTVGSRGDVVWFLRGALKPPQDVFNVLLSVGAGNVPESIMSEGGVALFASWLSATEKTRSLLEHGENLTGLVPRDEALSANRLGKLLLNSITQSSRNLARLTEFAFVHDVVYTEDFPSSASESLPGEEQVLFTMASASRVYRTLEGGNVTLETDNSRRPKESLTASTPVRGPGITSVLNGKHDLLTDTGVLHLVDSLLFPADMEITIEDLLLSSGLTEMHELVSRTRFSYILGADPALITEDLNETLDGWDRHAPQPYVLLAPKSGAFSPHLLSVLRNDSEAREAFVARHLVKLPGATEDCSPGTPNKDDTSNKALHGFQPKPFPSHSGWFPTWRRKSSRMQPHAKIHSWPPAAPGPGPVTHPLQSFVPLDISDGLVWGTCANNRLNEMVLRVIPTPKESEKSFRDSRRLSEVDAQTGGKGLTYLVGINNAYGSATGRGHSARIIDHGVQVPLRSESRSSLMRPAEKQHSGGVLLIDSILAYDPLWDSPQQHWAAWILSLTVTGCACYLLYRVTQICEEHRRARRMAEPLEGEEE